MLGNRGTKHRMPRPLARTASFVPICTAIVLVICGASAFAEDVVRLTNGQTLRGEIQSYDERGVEIRLDSGATSFHRPADVESVETTYSPPHEAAKEALARRDLDGAIVSLKAALAEEKRPWARLRIRAEMVRVYQTIGQWAQAGQLFLEISSQRTDMEVMAIAPLVWQEEAVDELGLAQARQWMTDERPAARLLAASWLLGGADPIGAKSALEELVAVDARIGAMARAQLWRTANRPAPNEIDRFQAQIGRLPESVRSGPQFVLASLLEREGRHQDAALAFLWIAYVYSPGSDLSAEALLRAADSCRQCALLEDADRIYRQVVDDYPGTHWAARARKEREVANPTSNTP